MLSCIAGKQKVNTIDHNHKDLRKWSNKGILKCPVCGGQMLFRKGEIKIPHFAHRYKRECDCGYWENETKEHFLGKELLYKWLKRQPNINDLELEKWIPETKQRPDIYFLLNDIEHVIEYQCSNMKLETFLDRRSLYALNNINDIWIFGSSENSSFNPTRRKAIDKDYFNQINFSYYFDPIENDFVKVKFNKRYNGSIFDSENFYIEDGNIFLNEETKKRFDQSLQQLLKKQKEHEKEEKLKLLSYQRKLFIKVKEEIEIEGNNKRKEPIINKMWGIPTPDEVEEKRRTRERNKRKVYEEISKQLKGNALTFYNDLNQAKSNSNRDNFVYYRDKSNKVDLHRLCFAIRNVIGSSEKDAHIFIPYCNFDKSFAKWIRKYFPHSKSIFIKGDKEVQKWDQ